MCYWFSLIFSIFMGLGSLMLTLSKFYSVESPTIDRFNLVKCSQSGKFSLFILGIISHFCLPLIFPNDWPSHKKIRVVAMSAFLIIHYWHARILGIHKILTLPYVPKSLICSHWMQDSSCDNVIFLHHSVTPIHELTIIGVTKVWHNQFPN